MFIKGQTCDSASLSKIPSSSVSMPKRETRQPKQEAFLVYSACYTESRRETGRKSFKGRQRRRGQRDVSSACWHATIC